MQSANSRRHKKPDLEQVLYILREVNTLPIFGSEPMYELTKKNIAKIKSALEIPFVSFFGEEKYITLEEKAAAILYYVSKNHAFPNDNKRTAVILMLALLAANDKWTDFSSEELYSLSLKIASNPSKDHEKNVQSVVNELKNRTVDF